MFRLTNKEDKIPFRKAFLLFIDSIKRVWRFDRKYVFVSCFVLIVDTLIEALTVLAVAVFNYRIAMGAAQYSSYIYAYYPILIILVLSVLNSIFFSVWRWMETKSMDIITAFLLHESVKKLIRLTMHLTTIRSSTTKCKKDGHKTGKCLLIVYRRSFALYLV